MWKHKAVLHVALLNPDAWGVQAFYVFRTCKLRGKIKHLDEIRSKSSRHSKCASVTGTWNAHFCYSTCVFWPSLRFPKRHSKFQSVTIYIYIYMYIDAGSRNHPWPCLASHTGVIHWWNPQTSAQQLAHCFAAKLRPLLPLWGFSTRWAQL